MKRGKIIGEVWAARKVGKLDGKRLVLVGIDGEDRVVVAIDTLSASVGQTVLVSFGSGARNVLAPGPHNRALVCDAAISLLEDGAT